MKMKRTIALCLTLAICASLAIGGTMAYLSDSDSDVNVMTMGSVYIDQIESSRGENGELEPYRNPGAMMPGVYDELDTDNDGYWTADVKGAIDKIVTVENTGRSSAYVRTLIAVPADTVEGGEDTILLNFDENDEWELHGQEPQHQITLNGMAYNVFVANYKTALAKDVTTAPSLLQVLMNKKATNDDVDQLTVNGTQTEIYVLSQAVQVDGFADAAAAFMAAFQNGAALNNSLVQTWFENIAPAEHAYVSSVEELEKALKEGGVVALSGDMEIEKQLTVPAGSTVELNLNGYEISIATHKNEGALLRNEGNLKLTGGTLSSTGANGGSAVMNTGTMVINDATLNGAPNTDGSWPSYTVNNTGNLTINNTKITSVHGAISSYGEGAVVTLNNSEIDMTGIPGFTSHGMYTYNSGKIIVNGGTYVNHATDQNSTGGSVINGKVIIYDGDFEGRIAYDYYGTPEFMGGTYSVQPNVKYVAKGYEVNKVGDKWIVSMKPMDTAAALNELLSAKKVSNVTVNLSGDNYDFISVENELENVTFVVPDDVDKANLRFNIKSGAVLKNVTFEGLDTYHADSSSAYVDGGVINIDAGAQVENLMIVGGTFEATGGRSCIVGISEPSAQVTISDCKINGSKYVVYGSNPIDKLTVENCEISNIGSWAILMNAGDAVGANLTINNNTFDTCPDGIAKYLGSSQPAGATTVFTNNTLIDCKGHDGSDAKWFTIPADASTITVSGNTLNGAAWTPGAAQGLGK